MTSYSHNRNLKLKVVILVGSSASIFMVTCFLPEILAFCRNEILGCFFTSFASPPSSS